MSIKASYDTVGEKVFSFPCNIYKDGKFVKSVNNSDYTKTETILTSFDDNEIAIFKGNDAGYFLAVLHEGEPVKVIESFISIDDLYSYINRNRSDCCKFNGSLFNNDLFFTYYLLRHVRAYSNPERPHFHYLVKRVKTIDDFNALYVTYESLYDKRDKSKKYFSVDEFCEMLTPNELNLLKFTLFANTEDTDLCDSWASSFLFMLRDLSKNAFAFCRITDDQIDEQFRILKMNPLYFVYRIRDNIGNPSVFYFDCGVVNSYLKPEDEMRLWRSGKKFREYLGENNNYVIDMNEPEDKS